MANKMLIDATHPEETRVVVVRGNRVEEFDFESAQRKQLRGNIYLAKVTRVEPSLQAAFVDYGGNRHGFLAFSEIHPDYYQIPVADRQALLDEEERAHRAADDEDERPARSRQRSSSRKRDDTKRQAVSSDAGAEAGPAADEQTEGVPAEAGDVEGTDIVADSITPTGDDAVSSSETSEPEATVQADADVPAVDEPVESESAPSMEAPAAEEQVVVDLAPAAETSSEPVSEPTADIGNEAVSQPGSESDNEHPEEADGSNIVEISTAGPESEEVVESVGGADAMEEVPERTHRLRRQYKIQEVIKRRQVMLVQVVKEERGTKGAALTTYLSLAGRYSVLMPNTARGGGISRKITDSADRRRLKEVAQELDVPEGMGVILRTAGASRTKTEIKRDFEYLLRLWETVRDLTLKSTAPTLVYEEGSLVKRSIRDLYNKDIDEVLVAGDDAYREAKDFMRMLMPSHAKNVKPYHDPQPVFTRYGVESQLDAMFTPIVQLRSGGYLVLNQTEALVAIDVNSGRATREHHIEDTALKTNLEAAEEVARQLRLRDLAGLIVIDFIDMDEKRNNRAVERKLKDCLKNDRARIQVGHISHFGLMEMSRQRIRSSVLESSTDKCPHCGGTGHVRSVSSVALQVLRNIEEMLLKGATHNLIVRTRTDIALYVLNHKRAHLRTLEERFQVSLSVNADETVSAAQPFVVERGEQVHSLEQAKAIIAVQPTSVAPMEDEDDEADFDTADEAEAEETAEAAATEQVDGEQPASSSKKRSRRRRGRRSSSEPREGATAAAVEDQEATTSEPAAGWSQEEAAEDDTAADDEDEAPASAGGESAAEGESRSESSRSRRRRGRRGGRRSRRGSEGENGHSEPAVVTHDESGFVVADADQSEQEHIAAAVESYEPRPDVSPDAGGADAPEAQPAPALAVTSPAPVIEPPAPVEQPSRRRSTVREPVSFFTGESTPAPVFQAPVPEPAPSAPELVEASVQTTEAAPQPEAEAPRRAGWWSRKILGKG